MADTSKKWAKRVAAWRASGLSSTAFCAGQQFTAGGLRHWAHRLRKLETQGRGSPPPAVRLARLVRAPTTASAALPETASVSPKAPGGASLEAAQAPAPPLLVEMQGVRLGVPAGFDLATLASVLDLLDRRSGGGSPR